jgi:hypothetical protein
MRAFEAAIGRGGVGIDRRRDHLVGAYIRLTTSTFCCDIAAKYPAFQAGT